MAVARRASATATGTGTTPAVAKASLAGLADGDVVVITVHKDQASAGGSFSAVGTGWTKEAENLWSSGGRNHGAAVFRKVLTSVAGEPASWQFTSSVSDDWTIEAVAYSGVDNTTPIDAAIVGNAGVDNANPVPPAITLVTGGSMVVTMHASTQLAPSIVQGPPAGFTLATGVMGAGNSFVQMADRIEGTPGAKTYTAWQNTSGDASGEWIVWTLALRSAAGAPKVLTPTPVAVYALAPTFDPAELDLAPSPVAASLSAVAPHLELTPPIVLTPTPVAASLLVPPPSIDGGEPVDVPLPPVPDTRTPLKRFRDAVRRSHIFAREVWACEADGTRLARLAPVKGAGSSITIGSGLVRTSANLTIANSDGSATPAPGAAIWWDHPLLVRFGAQGEDGTWEWFELPLLWPDEPEADLAGRVVRIYARDALRIVSSDSKLAAPLILPAGSALAPAFRRLLVLVGAPDDDEGFDLIDGGASFGEESAYEAGTQVASILSQWQVDHGLDLYAAAPAVFTLRPVPDPLTVEAAATFALGREVQLMGLRKRWRNRAKNHARVEGVDPDGVPFVVEAFDTNPESPVQFGRAGVGDLVIEWTSDSITSRAQAREVAESLLVRNAVEEELDATVPVDPSLTRRDVVRIEEPGTDTIGTFSLEEMQLPLEPGTQTFTVRRERTLG